MNLPTLPPIAGLLVLLLFLGLMPTASAHHPSDLMETNEGASVAEIEAFEGNLLNLYYDCGLMEKNLKFSIFKYAMTGYFNLLSEGRLSNNKKVITIIDYRKSANDKRFYVIDLEQKKVLHHTYVAHGKRSGMIHARYFSNTPESYQSSLGFFKTAETYQGKHGYSLRLQGLEGSFNSNARSRAIVMHGAHYVNESYINRHGRLGRSHGCPAVPSAENDAIINNIKYGTCIFAYYDKVDYLNNSNYLNINKAASYYSRSFDSYTYR